LVEPAHPEYFAALLGQFPDGLHDQFEKFIVKQDFFAGFI
jgi:hypothetical protein